MMNNGFKDEMYSRCAYINNNLFAISGCVLSHKIILNLFLYFMCEALSCSNMLRVLALSKYFIFLYRKRYVDLLTIYSFYFARLYPHRMHPDVPVYKLI